MDVPIDDRKCFGVGFDTAVVRSTIGVGDKLIDTERRFTLDWFEDAIEIEVNGDTSWCTVGLQSAAGAAGSRAQEAQECRRSPWISTFWSEAGKVAVGQLARMRRNTSECSCMISPGGNNSS